MNGLASQQARTLSRKEYAKVVIGRAKELISKFKEAFPDIQVKIMGPNGISLNGGMGHSYGCRSPLSDWYEILYYAHELELAYQEMAEEDGWKDFVEVLNIAGQFDSENAFPAKPKPVNVRSQVTEIIGTNGVHPTIPGYLQIGDAIYRNVVASFMSE